MVRQAYKFEETVGAGGKLELTIPIAEGTPVEVVVLSPRSDEWDELAQAAGSSTDFWNNPFDDEDWNNA